MDRDTARRHAATGARYLNYCQRASTDDQKPGWIEFQAALALAVSYPFLDLRDLTPEHLIAPMLAQLQAWHAAGLQNTLSAQDRLNGLYGICANCGEFRPKEIGGVPVRETMPYAATGVHVCEQCRKDTHLESSPLKEKSYYG